MKNKTTIGKKIFMVLTEKKLEKMGFRKTDIKTIMSLYKQGYHTDIRIVHPSKSGVNKRIIYEIEISPRFYSK